MAPKPKGILTRAQVERMLSACAKSWSGHRDRALIITQYRTGIRPGEALSLRASDLIDRDGVTVVRVERPKGWQRAEAPAPPREVGLDARTADALRGWLAERGDAAGPLFPARHGGQMSIQAWGRRLASIARRAGLDGVRVHPHGLRHTAAHEVYRESRDLIATSRFLGHTNVQTTITYLSQIGSSEAVVSMTSGRSW